MTKLLTKIVDVKPDEIRALWLAFVFNFLVLGGYYIMRPIRDSIAGANKLETLPWMFTATLVAMLIANAVFAAIFWAFMTDLFTVEQGKRLYGFIAVGGSLGGILGPYITKHYVQQIGPANLLAISALIFLIAILLVRFFPSGFTEAGKATAVEEKPIGGSIWSGLTHIARSPYLFGLAASMLIYTTTSTWAYFQQSDLTRAAFQDSNARTAFLASLDMWVNSITVVIQIFLTGRLLKWFGVGFTLVAMPFLSMVGFGAMGISPSLGLLAAFQVVRRAAAYALMRPSREILFTVFRREDKYKVKSVTDTLGYRTGDQLGAWSYHGLQGLGLSLNAISWIAVPITAAWCALSIWLARKQRVLADAQAKRNRSSPLTDLAAPEPA